MWFSQDFQRRPDVVRFVWFDGRNLGLDQRRFTIEVLSRKIFSFMVRPRKVQRRRDKISGRDGQARPSNDPFPTMGGWLCGLLHLDGFRCDMMQIAGVVFAHECREPNLTVHHLIGLQLEPDFDLTSARCRDHLALNPLSC